jgi:hypothetical protein
MGTTKNEHRERRVPLHREAARALRWWWEDGWGCYVGRHPTLADPIFPGPSGGWSRPASAAQLRRDLKTAGQSGEGITAQALRRSFSSLLDAAGVSEEVRGRLMGHAPKTVTAKHYTAAALERDRAEVEKIPLRWLVPREDERGTDNGGDIPEPVTTWIVPDTVPQLVPAAQESELSAEPPSRFELETYGLRRRRQMVPEAERHLQRPRRSRVIPVRATFNRKPTVSATKLLRGAPPSATKASTAPHPRRSEASSATSSPR